MSFNFISKSEWLIARPFGATFIWSQNARFDGVFALPFGHISLPPIVPQNVSVKPASLPYLISQDDFGVGLEDEVSLSDEGRLSSDTENLNNTAGNVSRKDAAGPVDGSSLAAAVHNQLSFN